MFEQRHLCPSTQFLPWIWAEHEWVMVLMVHGLMGHPQCPSTLLCCHSDTLSSLLPDSANITTFEQPCSRVTSQFLSRLWTQPCHWTPSSPTPKHPCSQYSTYRLSLPTQDLRLGSYHLWLHPTKDTGESSNHPLQLSLTFPFHHMCSFLPIARFAISCTV